MDITYRELRNGDIVHLQGYRFLVTDIRVASEKGQRAIAKAEGRS